MSTIAIIACRLFVALVFLVVAMGYLLAVTLQFIVETTMGLAALSWRLSGRVAAAVRGRS